MVENADKNLALTRLLSPFSSKHFIILKFLTLFNFIYLFIFKVVSTPNMGLELRILRSRVTGATTEPARHPSKHFRNPSFNEYLKLSKIIFRMNLNFLWKFFF